MAYIGTASSAGGRIGGAVQAAQPFSTQTPTYSNQVANLGIPDSGGAGTNSPYADVGKLQMNLLDPMPHLAAGQSPNETGGFITGLLGAFGGTFGDPGREVGQAVGHVLEAPLGLAGNVLGTAGNIPIPFGSEIAGAIGGGFEAAGITKHGQAAPTIVSDLLAPFSQPGGVTLGGLTQTAMGGLGLLERGVERTYAGSGMRGALPADLEAAVAAGTMSRDEATDQAVIRGTGFTNDPYTNLLWSIIGDPVTWLSLGVGGVSSAAEGAQKVERVAQSAGEIGRTEELSTGAAAAMRSRVVTDVNLAATGVKDLSRMQKVNLSTIGRLPGFDSTLVPVANQVIRLTDPLKIFSGGDIGRRSMEAVATSASTGVMASYRFDVVNRVHQAIAGATNDGLAHMNNLLGIATSNMLNQYIIDDLSSEYVRRGAIPAASGAEGVAVNTLVLAREMKGRGALDASVGRDMETMAEKFKPFGEEFRGDQAAMDADKTKRLAYAGQVSPDAIKGLKGGYDEWAYSHLVSYIEAGRRLLDDVQPALKDIVDKGGEMPEGLRNPEQFTIAARGTLTGDRWAEIEAMIQAGDADGVRAAIKRYRDFDWINEKGIPVEKNADLFDTLQNWADTNKDGLMKEVRLKDDAGLWRENLPQPLLDWAKEAEDLGYTLTRMPEEGEGMWRVTRDREGRMINMRPFIPFSTEASTVANPGFLDRLRMQAFRQIRTDRILWTNRRKFVQLMTADARLSPQAADSIYKSIMYSAGERGITPRGLEPREIMAAAQRALKAEGAKGAQGLGTMSETELTHNLLVAFDGDIGLIGVTQKITGQAKVRLPGAGENYWGKLSERLYPMARFGLNAFFMVQEMFEPYVLNLMRGVPVPLSKHSDQFQEALAFRHAVNNLVNSDLSADGAKMEVAEVQRIMQAGIQQSHDHLGPATRFGRAAGGLWGSISERKEVAVSGLARKIIGERMKEAFIQIKGPEFWQELERMYGTDPAIIAEHWLASSFTIADSNGEAVTAFIDLLKPANVGPHTRIFRGEGPGVRWHHLTTLLGRTEPGADEDLIRQLKAAYRPLDEAAVPADAVSRDAFYAMTDEAGIDREFAQRAYQMATGPEVADFYDGYRKAFLRNVKGAVNKDAGVKAAKALVQVRARVMGVTEEEFIKQHFAAAPELATMAEAEAHGGAGALLEMVDNAAGQIRAKRFAAGRNIDEITDQLGLSLLPERPVKESFRHRVGGQLWERGAEGEGVNRQVIGELPDADAAEHYFNTVAATDPARLRAHVADMEAQIAAVPKTGSKAWKALSQEERDTATQLRGDIGSSTKALAKADAIRRRPLYTFEDAEGRRYYLGGVRAQDLVDMARDIMPPAEGLAAKDWYTDLRAGLVNTFGESNADTVLRMFGVSQANDSPVNGLMMVLRAFEQAYTQGFQKGKMSEREFITTFSRTVKGFDKRLGLQLNAENITKALLDMPVDRGFAAKLNDFLDSMAGNTTRRWTGRAAGSGMPVAVDRHTARDIGFMDQKVISHLADLEYNDFLPNNVVVLKDMAGQEIATVRKDTVRVRDPQTGNMKNEERWHLTDRDGNYVEPDGKGGYTPSETPVEAGDVGTKPDDAQYEHGVGLINEAARLFNEQGVWRKTDWTPAEVQAVGWMRVQKTLGGMEESPMDTMRASTYVVSPAIEPQLGSDLGPLARVVQTLSPRSRQAVSRKVLTDFAQSVTADWGVASIVSDGLEHADTMLPLRGPAAHTWGADGWSLGRHVTADEAATLRARGMAYVKELEGKTASIDPLLNNFDRVVDDVHAAISTPGGQATLDPRTGQVVKRADGQFVSMIGSSVSLTPADAADPAKVRAALEQIVNANRDPLTRDRHVIDVVSSETGRVDFSPAILTQDLEDAEGVQLALDRPGGGYGFDTGHGVQAPLVQHPGGIRPLSWLSTEQSAMDFADRASVTTRNVVKVPLRRPVGQFKPDTFRPIISLTLPGVADETEAQQKLLRLVNEARQEEIRFNRQGTFDWAVVKDPNGRMTLRIIDDAPPETAFFERYAKKSEEGAPVTYKKGMLVPEALRKRVQRWADAAGVDDPFQQDVYHGPLYRAEPPKTKAGAYDWSAKAHIDDTVKRLRDRGRDVTADDVTRWRDEYARSLDAAVRSEDPSVVSGAVRGDALHDQRAGATFGYTREADDNRVIIGATKNADSVTGLHELAHVFAKDLDPSSRALIQRVRASTLLDERGATEARIKEIQAKLAPQEVVKPGEVSAADQAQHDEASKAYNQAQAEYETKLAAQQAVERPAAGLATELRAQGAEQAQARAGGKAVAKDYYAHDVGRVESTLGQLEDQGHDVSGVRQALAEYNAVPARPEDVFQAKMREIWDPFYAKYPGGDPEALAGAELKAYRADRKAAETAQDELQRATPKTVRPRSIAYESGTGQPLEAGLYGGRKQGPVEIGIPGYEHKMPTQAEQKAAGVGYAASEKAGVKVMTAKQTAWNKVIDELDQVEPAVSDAHTQLADKWRASEKRNGLTMEKNLVALEGQGYEIGPAMDALDEYRVLERGDYESAEDFADARTDAWETVLDEIDQLEPPAPAAGEALVPPTPPAPPQPGPPATVLQERSPSTQRKYKSQLAALQNGLGELTDEGQWSRAHEEWFVDQFQKWMKSGRPPVRELGNAFEHFRNYLSEIWSTLRTSKTISQEAHPEMVKLFESMFTNRVPTVAYDADQNALMLAAKQSVRQGIQEAETTQYFKPGRSMMERSINHPFLGMYPASYYWGKILPEMVRFLALRPFGLKTPLLGWNVARQVNDTVTMQQSIDPGVRQFLHDNGEFLQTINMLMPAVPNDIPVNAPLWARRVSEQGLQNADLVAHGQAAKPVDYMKGVADSAAYAFGPYSSLKQAGALLGGLGNVGRSAIAQLPGQQQAPAPGSQAGAIPVNPLTGLPLK